MRPRLLFVSNLFPDREEPYRGLDNATLLHHLRSRWDIRVISPRPSLKAWMGGASQLAARAEDELLRPTFVPAPYVPKIGSRWNHLLMAHALRPQLKASHQEFAWDMVLGAWLYPDGCALMRACMDAPVALIAQGSDVHHYLHQPVRRRLILQAAGKAAVVFTRSASLGKMLASAGADSGRVHPLHNGVDTECFRWRDQRGAREEMGVDEQTRLVLFVGNLLPVKDPHLLLEAFDCLRRNDRAGGWQLALAGKGPLRLDLEGKVRALGLASCVKFLGPLPAREIARWMNAADVLCLTSHNEGLPNVVLEAQASGLPVVATDVGGIAEVIDADWKGTLCKSRDPNHLALALRNAASKADRHRIAAHGAQRKWENVAALCHNTLAASLPFQ